MLPVDLERFWHDDAIAHRDPFAADLPQPANGVRMSYETIFDELGHPFDMRRLEEDYPFARSAAAAYNDRAQKIVGKRLLDESAYDPARRFPRVRGLGEVFGCKLTKDRWSDWLHPAAATPEELARLLDRVQAMTLDDMRRAMLPPDWDEACARLLAEQGRRPHLGRWQRGPVTLAMSIYGEENTIFLIMDQPDLAARFRDVLLRAMLDYFSVCDRISEVEYAADGKPVRGGFSFLDDNCALLTAEMYAFFGAPILKAVFDRFASRPGDRRYQHSDSDMGHLLHELAATGLTAVNFGPNVRFADIRAAMPRAEVHGTLAPFTFMSNDEGAILREVRRDLDEARSTRGLVVATAGSINNGSRLTSMRTVMHAIQNCGW